MCCLDSAAFGTENSNVKKLRFAVSNEQHVAIDEILYIAMKRVGVDMSIFPMGKVAAIDGVVSGLYDGMYVQPAGIENENQSLIRVATPIAQMNFLALAPKGSKKRFTAWSDLSGYRVGFLYQRPYMEEHLPAGLRGMVRKHTWIDLLQTLQNGECDVILTQTILDKEFIVPDYAEHAGVVDSAPAYIYLNAKHAGLAKALENSLQSMRADGTTDTVLHKKINEDRDVKVVLHLSSYSSEMVWEQKIARGINSVFFDDLKIAYYSVALNSFRILDEERRYTIALNTLRNYFMTNDVDAIIVSDNDALRFVSSYYNILFSDTPIIFCGINLFDESLFGGIKKDISGVVEAMSAKENVEEMLRLFPKTKRIFILTDYTEIGRTWRKDAELQLASYADRVAITYNDDLPVAVLLAQIAALDADTLVLAGPYFIDAEDRYMPQEELHHNLVESVRGPFFGFFDGTQGMGALGGRYADAVLQGKTAAKMVQGLLRGEGLPPVIRDSEKDNRWVFDYTVMEKFGIQASQLPEGSVILNKPPSLRETDPVLFWTLVCAGVSGAIIILILACGIWLLRKRNAKLRAAEFAAQEARSRIQHIIETSPIDYAMIQNGVVIENNSFHRESAGTQVGDNLFDKYANLGYDMSPLEAAYAEVLRDEAAVRRLPWKIIARTGETRRYMFNVGAAEYGGEAAIVIWGMDVEEMERQKDALAQANESLQRVIEAAPLPIALCDPVQRLIIQANEAWANLFQFRNKEDTTGFSLKEGFGVPSIAYSLREALDSDETLSWDCKFKTLTGTVFDAMIYAKSIVYNNVHCLVTCVRDLSEEKLRARMLQNAADKEREASRLKTQFVMNMSHEIRTPMNAIIGMANIAKRSDDLGAVHKCMENIEEASSHLMGIIDDVLDLSMIEDGKLKLRPEEIPLAQTVASVLTMMRPEADKHEVSLAFELDALGDDRVLADASRLCQVLINLVSNAIKFNRRGGSVAVAAQPLSRQGGRAQYRFSVTDTGIGIPADKLATLFRPFEQVDGSTTRRHGGAGLGLALSKTFVWMMGGTVDLTSEEGVGSVFSFTITVPLVTETPHPEEGAAGERAPLDFSAMRVLIADDVELNRIIAETMFNDLGLEVELAEDGRQALGMVAASPPGYYDFVLMDMQMPELDGCGATRAIRQLDRPDAAALPIVAMTANVTQDDIAMCLRAGMNGHIGKPIDADAAVAAISDIFHRAGR